MGIREAILGINNRLSETLGLMRDVNRRQPLVRFATNTEEKLDEELKVERLTTNED